MNFPVCPHQEDFGGVWTSFDGFGVRKKVNLIEYPFTFFCWRCYETPEVQDFDRAVQIETDKAIHDAGWCGFVDAWIGPCEILGDCEKHAKYKCWKCKEKATRSCDYTGMLVCGMPECNDHPHKHKGE